MDAHAAKRPELRDDLHITPLSGGEQGLYVVEDPLRNMFFKIGQREYRFLCRLEKGIDLESYRNGDEDEHDDLSQEEALTLLTWLAGKQLLKNQSPATLQQIDRAEQRARRKATAMSRLNPIIFRVPLFNPDPWLTRLMPWIGWLAGPLFFMLWLSLGIISLSILFTSWNQFVSQSETFFSPQNLIVITLVWVALKVLHELGHSVTCKRHGGRVYEIGILFILFIPLTYVNATSSWSFSSRWQRIHVGTAGMYMELFAAWCALIYWFFNMDSPAGLIAHHTVLIAGVSSLLFNANPLMRFDGYYILSDLVKVPNLYFRGLGAVRRGVDKILLGVSTARDGGRDNLLISLYGLCVYLWRILVVVTLSVLACSLLGGWGLLLAVLALGSWAYQGAASLISRIGAYRKQNRAVPLQFTLRLTVLTALLSFILFGFGYRANLSAPAVVLFDQQEWVRTGTSGFIEEIFAEDGAPVEKGQLIAVLGNDDLAAEARDYDLQLAIALLRKRQADAGGNYSASQILSEQIEVLGSRRANLQSDLEALKVVAPLSGMINGDISNRIGMFASKGEKLLQIIGPGSKQLVASVSQDNIGALQNDPQKEVMIDMSFSGLGTFVSTVTDISPTATTRLAHFSLGAPFGGSLDVKRAASGSGETDYELFLPHISVDVALPADLQQRARSGQHGLIRYRGLELPPAVHLWQWMTKWFRNKQDPAGVSAG